MEKTFDCLAMKAEIQAKIYEETKDMTFAEYRAYLDKSLENNKWWHGLVAREPAMDTDLPQWEKDSIDSRQDLAQHHPERLKPVETLLEAL